MHFHNYMKLFIVTVEGPTSHNVPGCRIQLFDEHVGEKNYSSLNTAPVISIPISSPRVLPPLVQPVGLYCHPHRPPFPIINSPMPITTSPNSSQSPPLPFIHPPFSLFQSSTFDIPISPPRVIPRPRVIPTIVQPVGVYHRPHPLPFSDFTSTMPLSITHEPCLYPSTTAPPSAEEGQSSPLP